MKKSLHTIIGIASVCIWMCAAYFALKWFGHMAGGTISYNSRASAILIPALSGLALLYYTVNIGNIRQGKIILVTDDAGFGSAYLVFNSRGLKTPLFLIFVTHKFHTKKLVL